MSAKRKSHRVAIVGKVRYLLKRAINRITPRIPEQSSKNKPGSNTDVE